MAASPKTEGREGEEGGEQVGARFERRKGLRVEGVDGVEEQGEAGGAESGEAVEEAGGEPEGGKVEGEVESAGEDGVVVEGVKEAGFGEQSAFGGVKRGNEKTAEHERGDGGDEPAEGRCYHGFASPVSHSL